ncbi:glycogen/starch synthase [Gangjinia marincola]|uniref:starch synthase n=1 Tax=Gangjinia marincola TaxID=578463 RepID=A0ABP3XQA8_9FLAO
MTSAKNILFLSAENDAIPDCKAGGMADVVRDVPRHIAKGGDQVAVMTPAYGRLHEHGTKVGELNFIYRGQREMAELYTVPGKKDVSGLTHYVIHHPWIASGNIAHIYQDDVDQPFYTDANTFSLFCIASAEAIKQGFFGKLDIIHLHDWHTTLLLFLKREHPEYAALKKIKFVFSIHNLSIQGIRPFEHNHSSLTAFYPTVEYGQKGYRDERYADCINLMALGVRYADKVHTVSPSYKENILIPSDPPRFIGGEGLEKDLQQAEADHRLFGILNGVNYTNFRKPKKGKVYENSLRAIFQWLQDPKKSYKAEFLAEMGNKILELQKNKPAFICTSIARLTPQKFYFFKEDPSLLTAMADKLREVNGVFMLLGTGDPAYEELFREYGKDRKTFIFINGQSEDLIDSLYLDADLYLMPSLFEPCGISQMLAMRNGVPCLVHRTGGLIDTVQHGENGFSFGGSGYEEAKEDFKVKFNETVDLFFNNKEEWKRIKKNAKNQRFDWESSVKKYYELLY